MLKAQLQLYQNKVESSQNANKRPHVDPNQRAPNGDVFTKDTSYQKQRDDAKITEGKWKRNAVAKDKSNTVNQKRPRERVEHIPSARHVPSKRSSRKTDKRVLVGNKAIRNHQHRPVDKKAQSGHAQQKQHSSRIASSKSQSPIRHAPRRSSPARVSRSQGPGKDGFQTLSPGNNEKTATSARSTRRSLSPEKSDRKYGDGANRYRTLSPGRRAKSRSPERGHHMRAHSYAGDGYKSLPRGMTPMSLHQFAKDIPQGSHSTPNQQEDTPGQNTGQYITAKRRMDSVRSPQETYSEKRNIEMDTKQRYSNNANTVHKARLNNTDTNITLPPGRYQTITTNVTERNRVPNGHVRSQSLSLDTTPISPKDINNNSKGWFTLGKTVKRLPQESSRAKRHFPVMTDSRSWSQHWKPIQSSPLQIPITGTSSPEKAVHSPVMKRTPVPSASQNMPSRSPQKILPEPTRPFDRNPVNRSLSERKVDKSYVSRSQSERKFIDKDTLNRSLHEDIKKQNGSPVFRKKLYFTDTSQPAGSVSMPGTPSVLRHHNKSTLIRPASVHGRTQSLDASQSNAAHSNRDTLNIPMQIQHRKESPIRNESILRKRSSSLDRDVKSRSVGHERSVSADSTHPVTSGRLKMFKRMLSLPENAENSRTKAGGIKGILRRHASIDAIPKDSERHLKSAQGILTLKERAYKDLQNKNTNKSNTLGRNFKPMNLKELKAKNQNKQYVRNTVRRHSIGNADRKEYLQNTENGSIPLKDDIFNEDNYRVIYTSKSAPSSPRSKLRSPTSPSSPTSPVLYGEGQRERGIYIKSVVPGGGAAADGRLQAGDQLIEVDSNSLIGLTQEKAAEMMTKTGNRVTLKVAKQGAIYHGLATVLSQQSPIMQRAGPHGNAPYGQGPPGGKPMGPPQQQPGGGPPGVNQQMKPRPMSEDVSRFGPPNGAPDQGGFGGGPHGPQGQRPINMQHGAKSSPSLASSRGPNDSFGMHPGMGGPGPHTGDPYGRPGGPQQDSRSKSVSNLERQDQGPHDFNRPAGSTSTLPRMHPQGPQQPMHPPGGPQGYPGGPVPHDMKHMSQPDLRGNREEGNDYENYPPGPPPGANRPGGPPGGDPRQQQPQQPDYVNQRDLKNQGSQSMHNLRGDDMNHSRVHEWNRRNEMANQNGGPPGGPGMYHSLQKALDPQSTIRGQKIGPRHNQQDPRDPRFSNQPPQQNYPHSPQPQGGAPHQQQNRHMPPPGHMGPPHEYPPPSRQAHLSPDAAYENIPAQRPFPQQRGPPPQGGQMDPRMRTVSPDLPPPPDVPPEMPPPPAEDLRNTSHEDLPPPPPMQGGGPEPMRGPGGYPNNRFATPQQPSSPSGPGYNQQQKNYQNLPPMQDRRQEGMYTQAPSQGQPQPRPQDSAQAGGNLTFNSRSQSTGTLNRSGANQPSSQKAEPPKSAAASLAASRKPPPPIAAKPKLNLAEIRKGFTQSPWEREEKERELLRREDDMRMQRDNEIQDLESKTYLSHEEQERLRRLRLDREFDKRVTEVNNRGGDDNEDDDDDITPTARVKMLRQMNDDMEKKRHSLEEDKKRQEQSRQKDLETNERTERRLQQYEQEREEQRQRQVKRQQKQQQEQEELFKKQRELREIQRREFEEAKRQQREDEQRLEEQKRQELRRKKEMEKEQMLEMQRAREVEERAIREREDQMRRQFDRMNMSDSYGGAPPPSSAAGAPPPGAVNPNDSYSVVLNRAAPAPPERGSSYMYGRAGSSQNIPTSVHNDTSQYPPRGPTPQSVAGAKKSVSFHSNLATEMGGVRRGTKDSTGSESSYINYQVTVGSPEQDEAVSPAFAYNRGPPGPGAGGGNSDAVNQLFDNPPNSQYQGGPPYGGGPQGGPPSSQYQQPPASQYPGGGTQYPPSSQPPSSQYQHPHQPPSSQYNPPPPASQQRPPQNMQYQNGPPYQGGPPPPQSGPQYQGGPPPPTSVYQNGPPNQYQSGPYQGGGGGYQGGPPPPSSQYQGYNAPPSHQQGGGVPSSPYNPNTNGGYEQQPPRTPQNTTLITNADTPGVVGGQEVYRDPRDRLLAEKNQGRGLMVPGSGERMSFRDKMKMFATEAGENTPQDRSKVSFAQRRIDSQLKSP